MILKANVQARDTSLLWLADAHLDFHQWTSLMVAWRVWEAALPNRMMMMEGLVA